MSATPTYRRLAWGLAPLAVVSLAVAASWTNEKAGPAAGPDDASTAVAVMADREPARTAGLEVAAELGVIGAQLKLARMYAKGDGVGRSDTKAFEHYRRIVAEHDEVRPHHARAGQVASAYVALGKYYRTGIPGSAIKADPNRALGLLHYAASYFGDAEAQYTLAQMYLEGEGVPKNTRLAISWLTNAAKKRHAKSQALLGHLLWRGAKDVHRRPQKGLALLSLARQNARGEDEARWIEQLYQSARSNAQSHEREGAAELAGRWQARMGHVKVVSQPQRPETAQTAPVTAASAEAASQSGAAAGFTGTGLEAPSTPR